MKSRMSSLRAWWILAGPLSSHRHTAWTSLRDRQGTQSKLFKSNYAPQTLYPVICELMMRELHSLCSCASFPRLILFLRLKAAICEVILNTDITVNNHPTLIITHLL